MNKNQKQLQEAFGLYQQGRLPEAAKIYERLIKQDPGNLDALHFFGILKVSVGKFDEARQLIERSLDTAAINLSYVENYASILFQIGDYGRAVNVCTKTIREHGRTETLQYVLAISLHKLGRQKEAIEEFDSLLSAYPNHLAGTNEKASALAELQRYDEALSCVEKALSIHPGYAGAYLNKGNILAKLKKYEASIVAYEKALSLNRDLPEAYLGRAAAFRELKRFDECLAAYDRALALRADWAEAWYGRGLALAELKRNEDALAAYDRALVYKPDMTEAWLGRGYALAGLKRNEDALAAYDNALALKPDLTEAWLGRGYTLAELRRNEDALAAYDKVIALKPDMMEASLGRGRALSELRRFDAAVAAFDKVLLLESDSTGAWLGRGRALTELKRFDEALVAFDKALALDSDSAVAWLGRGNIFGEIKKYDDACSAYDRAIDLDQNFAEAYLNKSLVELTVGNFDKGWDLYEWRSRTKENVALHAHLKSLNASTRLDRRALTGKRVAILSDQGVGDEIMFASILPDLIADAKTIYYEVDPRLTGLFERSFPDVNIVPRGGRRNYIGEQICDVVLQAGSLGYAYRRRKEAFPRSPYLRAERTRIDKWKAKLANETTAKLKIGISWRGGTDKTRRNDRSIELEQLRSLIQRNDCYFLSLQYGNVGDEVTKFNGVGAGTVHRLLDDFNDFDDFAALIMALDLIISVQNTTIHMCGALGKKCWAMIPWRPEWRYGICDKSMIWYSSVELYRQTTPGDWVGLVELVKSNLANVSAEWKNG